MKQKISSLSTIRCCVSLRSCVLSSVVPEIRRQPESRGSVSVISVLFSLCRVQVYRLYPTRSSTSSPFVCHVALPSWNVSPFGHGLHHNIVDNSCYCFFFGSAEKTFGLCRLVYLKTKTRQLRGRQGTRRTCVDQRAKTK